MNVYDVEIRHNLAITTDRVEATSLGAAICAVVSSTRIGERVRIAAWLVKRNARLVPVAADATITPASDDDTHTSTEE